MRPHRFYLPDAIILINIKTSIAAIRKIYSGLNSNVGVRRFYRHLHITMESPIEGKVLSAFTTFVMITYRIIAAIRECIRACKSFSRGCKAVRVQKAAGRRVIVT